MSSEANNFTADQFAKQTCTQAALAIYYSYKLSTTAINYHWYPHIHSEDKIRAYIQTIGANVPHFWPKMFAKAIQKQDITSFFRPEEKDDIL